MGVQFSKPSSSDQSNPSSISSIASSDMSSSNSSETRELKHEKEPEQRAPVKESSDPSAEGAPADLEIKRGGGAPEGEAGEEEEEEEEVGECPFCLFMKEGGCRDEFIEWEKCVEEGEKNNEDIAERCFEITGNLKKCMEAHRDYYAPLLRAEEEAMKELEDKGKEREEATKQSEKEKGADRSDALNGSAANSQKKTVNGSS